MKMSKKICLFGILDFPFFIACDDKLANIICGIQSLSSKHPCCRCDVKSDDLKKQGTPGNFRSIRMQYKVLIEKDYEKMCAKDFHNVVHNPSFDQEDVKQVSEVIPPLEFHLLLGIVHRPSSLQINAKGVA